LVLVFFFSALSFVQAATYTLKTTMQGTAQTPGNWYTGATSSTGDGTGTPAGNFSTDGDVFQIISGQTAIFGASVTFGSTSSSGSGVTLNILSGGSATINSGLTITLAIKGAAKTTAMAVNGTIIFSGAGANQILTSITSGSANFTLASGATLKTINTNGVSGTNCSIAPAASFTTLSLNTAANYEFNGTSAQATLGLPATANNLTINNSSGITLTASTAVSSTLTQTSGNIAVGSNNLTVNGTHIAGTNVVSGAGAYTLASGATLNRNNINGIDGTITTTTKTLNPNANYVFSGTADQVTGALLTSAHNITLSNTAGKITLSADIAITGTITIPTGNTLDASTHVISSSGAIELQSGGTFITANSSGLNGSITLSGSKTFSTGANYTFNGTGAQATGSYFPSTVNNITVSGTSALTMSNSDITCNALTIDNGATFQIDAVKTVTVTGSNATTLGGAACLIIKSEGSFKDNGIAGSGTARVEKDLAVDAGRWWYIGNPMQSTSASAYGTLSGTASTGRRLLYYSEPSHTYIAVTDGATLNTALRGYSYKNFDAVATNVAYTGALNTGAIGANNNLTRQATGSNLGFNLVCNPYPSAIDIELFGSATTNLETSVWYRTNGNFATYNWSSHTGQGTPVSGQRYIPSMQAFWVRVANTFTTGGLQLANSHRAHNGQAFYKTGAETNVFRITVSDGITNDEAVVGFYQDAQDVFENFDSEKMFITDEDIPQLYSLTGDNAEVAINGQPELATNEERIVALGFSTNVAGTFTLNATNLADFDPSVSVYLEDVQQSVLQNLNQNASYTFTSGVVNTASRFKLHFGNMVTGISIEPKNIVFIYASENSIYVDIPEEATVEIYSSLGEKISSEHAVKGLNIITLNTVKGIYIVKIQTGMDVVTEKVFIGK